MALATVDTVDFELKLTELRVNGVSPAPTPTAASSRRAPAPSA